MLTQPGTVPGTNTHTYTHTSIHMATQLHRVSHRHRLATHKIAQTPKHLDRHVLMCKYSETHEQAPVHKLAALETVYTHRRLCSWELPDTPSPTEFGCPLQQEDVVLLGAAKGTQGRLEGAREAGRMELFPARVEWARRRRPSVSLPVGTAQRQGCLPTEAQ